MSRWFFTLGNGVVFKSLPKGKGPEQTHTKSPPPITSTNRFCNYHKSTGEKEPRISNHINAKHGFAIGKGCCSHKDFFQCHCKVCKLMVRVSHTMHSRWHDKKCLRKDHDMNPVAGFINAQRNLPES